MKGEVLKSPGAWAIPESKISEEIAGVGVSSGVNPPWPFYGGARARGCFLPCQISIPALFEEPKYPRGRRFRSEPCRLEDGRRKRRWTRRCEYTHPLFVKEPASRNLQEYINDFSKSLWVHCKYNTSGWPVLSSRPAMTSTCSSVRNFQKKVRILSST